MSDRKNRRSEPELAADAPFEQVLERLERLVDQLEDGSLPLEASLQAFEQGVALARQAQTSLDAMERRIEVLSQDGSLQALPEKREEDDV
ncbi:MAG: exodeoxyribonuclease VII small subunit [Pseudomonadota bacterium]